MPSVDWLNKIISVPITDLSLVSPGIYQHDLDTFRLSLKALEAGNDGVPFLDTHRHSATVTIGGVTLARVFEIINGYTVTYEDGQYAVNLVGANSNILDVANINQVSIRSSNSAGLAQVSTGSGLSPEQASQLTSLAATLESAGVFSTPALVNVPSGSGGGSATVENQIAIATAIGMLPTLAQMEASSRLTAIADLSGTNSTLATIQTALDSVAEDARDAKNFSLASL